MNQDFILSEKDRSLVSWVLIRYSRKPEKIAKNQINDGNTYLAIMKEASRAVSMYPPIIDEHGILLGTKF